MLIPIEKINEAKAKYGEKAIEEIVQYFGLEDSYNAKSKSCSCPWHRDKTPSFIWNEKNNSMHCFSCSRNYGILDLYMEQGMTYLKAVEKLFQNVNMDYNFSQRGVSSNSNYHYPKRECSNRNNVEKYLGLRGIDVKTLDYADVQSDINGNIAFHYYDSNDVLMTVKYRLGRKFDKNKDKAKCWAQKDADFSPLLFNMNRVDPMKPLVITEGECFKGDTEILTPNGWIRLDKYEGQEVLQVKKDLTGEFVKPLAYIDKNYDGLMYTASNQKNYSSTMTANHNMIYVDYKNRLIKKKCCEMPKSIGEGYIPVSVQLDGKGIPLTNEQIALYIAVSADCTIDTRKTVRHSRFGAKKERKYLRLKQILNKLNISYFDNSKASNGCYYLGFRTPDYIISKKFPEEWLSLATIEQRKFILEEMTYWDGNKVLNRNQVEYSSKYYSQAVWMQTMAHTCGYMSTIIKRQNKHGEWFKVSILYGKKGVSFQRGFSDISEYKGKVYCVSVPTGMILIRNQGHISVCGNCDCLSVIEAGYHNVVSIPNGCSNTKWIEHNWDWLEQFDKIIVWFDNDEPGIKARTEVVHRLGTWRTYYTEISKDDKTPNGAQIKDANELLYFKGKDRVLEYINKPFDVPIENITDLSESEDFDIEHTEGLYTGIKDMDDKIYKLTFGTLNIITGKSGCVDCDTEFFNGYEWKKICDYKKDEKILQYNANGTAELITPLQYHKYPEDNLWEIQTKNGLNMCLSEEHNVWYKTSKNNLYHKTLKEIIYNHFNTTHGFQGKFITSFNYGGEGIKLSDDEIKLMCAVICEGNFDNTNNSVLCQMNIKNFKKKYALEDILNNLHYEYTKKEKFNDITTYYFKAPIRTKIFGKEWYECNNHQLQLICDNILQWNECITIKKNKKSHHMSFSTFVKENADFIQFAFSSCGYKAVISVYNHIDNHNKEYQYENLEYNINITKRNLVGIQHNKECIKPYKPKDGFKYCFTTNSGMWIMRRGGKICITGNSGKSVFVNQVAICQALNQGYDVFVFSGELPAPILRNWVETNMIGRDNITMKNNHIRVFNNEQRKLMQNWYKGRVMVYDNDYNTTATALLNKMEELARKCGTKVFLIDNLMMIDLECNEDSRLQAEKEFVNKLIFFAKKYNVLVFLVAHPRKTGETMLTKEDIAGSGNIVNLAHMVFSVHRYTDKEKQGETNMRNQYIKGKEPIPYDSCIEVLKNRITGVLPTTQLYFDYNSYRFYQTPEELWFRYKWDKRDILEFPLNTNDPNDHGVNEETGGSPF